MTIAAPFLLAKDCSSAGFSVDEQLPLRAAMSPERCAIEPGSYAGATATILGD